MNISKIQVPRYILELDELELMWLANILNRLSTYAECNKIDKEKLEDLILKLEEELD